MIGEHNQEQRALSTSLEGCLYPDAQSHDTSSPQISHTQKWSARPSLGYAQDPKKRLSLGAVSEVDLQMNPKNTRDLHLFGYHSFLRLQLCVLARHLRESVSASLEDERTGVDWNVACSCKRNTNSGTRQFQTPRKLSLRAVQCIQRV